MIFVNILVFKSLTNALKSWTIVAVTSWHLHVLYFQETEE